jgi:LysM repeat protein
LIKMVEDYQLAQFDNVSSAEIPMAGSRPAVNNNRPADNFPVSGNQPAYTPPSSGGNKPTYSSSDPNQLPYFDPSNPNGAPTAANPQSGGNYTTSNGGFVAPPPADMSGSRNDVKYIRAAAGQTLYEVAGKNNIRVETLQAYNEEVGDANRPLENGLVLYTQKKRNRWRGKEKTYTVKDCETMYDIAQKFGIKLSKLYSKNEMRDGEQPQVGEKLLLRRGWFQGADKPALRDTFSEWKRCKIPANVRPQMPTPVSRPGSNPNNVFDTEMSPNSGAQPATTGSNMNYPPPVQQPNYQNNTSYPTTSTEYPSTSTSYPTTTTEYPSTTTEYPSTSTSYPTTTTTEYPSTTSSPSYPSYPSTPAKPSAPAAKPTPKPTPSAPAAKPTAPAMGQFYTVQPKETLWGISQKFKTTVDALKKLNNMTTNDLKIGQQLRIK